MTDYAVNGRRKWHRKSRAGCNACKERKVKCDKQHPSCRNCLRRGLKCDFLPSPDDNVPLPTTVNLELELLHHFTVSTAASLSTEPRVRDLWRVLVPQIGFSTRYILDGVFALSALHMAKFMPARREALLSRAIQFHTASLEIALPLIPSINPHNASNLFLFAVLTVFFNVASPRKDDDILVVDHGVVPQWLHLLRGASAISDADEAILSSPLSLIFKASDSSHAFWTSHSPEEHPALANLEAAIRGKPTDDMAKQDTLITAVNGLKKSYTFLEHEGFTEEDKMRAFYHWLCQLSDDYLQLLKRLDNEAICVLAFFSVLLRELEKYWWCEGWAIHLLSRVYVLLDDEYRLWIRWPVEEIGWVPGCS